MSVAAARRKAKKKRKKCPRGKVLKRVKRKKRVRGRKVTYYKKVCVKRRKRTRKPPPKPPPPRDPLPPAPAVIVFPPPVSERPVPVFSRPTTERHMERLLWRAGFGPRPGDVERLSKMSLQSAVYSLTRPSGAATLSGPAPRDQNGPIAPGDAWGHDHLHWLDRMVRSSQPLVERMALVFHDWFATSTQSVEQHLMLDQAQLFRQKGLGSFRDLVSAVTANPAMLIWLNGLENSRWWPNENYARELMELFTLGANRGAYSEGDVRELARALTGWRATWTGELGWHNFRFDANRADTTDKTVFGKTGAFDWQDAGNLCVDHPLHSSFFVTKLWSYFIPTPPDAATQARLEGLYVSSGHSIRAVVEAILMHPTFYEGEEMVIPPVVYNAGLLRARGRGIDIGDWTWVGQFAGQKLFEPPNVAGWNDDKWLDTSTLRGRWMLANYVARPYQVDPWQTPYSETETAADAVAKAMAFWNYPTLSRETQSRIARFAETCMPSPLRDWQKSPYRAMRQNALRMLIATSPDMQVS